MTQENKSEFFIVPAGCKRMFELTILSDSLYMYGSLFVLKTAQALKTSYLNLYLFLSTINFTCCGLKLHLQIISVNWDFQHLEYHGHVVRDIFKYLYPCCFQCLFFYLLIIKATSPPPTFLER